MRHKLNIIFECPYNHKDVLEQLSFSLVLRQLNISAIVLDGVRYDLSELRDMDRRKGR